MIYLTNTMSSTKKSQRSWETTIESEMGDLPITVRYEINPGQHGDYHTETIHPSVMITEIEIGITQDVDPDYLEALALEIEEHLSNG